MKKLFGQFAKSESVEKRVLFKKPSVSIQDMASLLFALTVGTEDREGERTFRDEMAMISTDGLSPEVARIELALLTFSAVYIALFRLGGLRDLHGPKLDDVGSSYVARFKERAQQMPVFEDAFLKISETRLAAYSEAFDAWLEARSGVRGGEQTFAIGEIFFAFCGVRNSNPASLFFVSHKFNQTIESVAQRLRDCDLF